MYIDMSAENYWFDPSEMHSMAKYLEGIYYDRRVWLIAKLYDANDREGFEYVAWLGLNRKPQIKNDGLVFFNDGALRHCLRYRIVIAEKGDESWKTTSQFNDGRDWEWSVYCTGQLSEEDFP